MRCFVAVWPPPDVIEALGGLSRPPLDILRWSSRDQWHVTLRFFGELSDHDVGLAVGGARWRCPDRTGPLQVSGGPTTRSPWASFAHLASRRAGRSALGPLRARPRGWASLPPTGPSQAISPWRVPVPRLTSASNDSSSNRLNVPGRSSPFHWCRASYALKAPATASSPPSSWRPLLGNPFSQGLPVARRWGQGSEPPTGELSQPWARTGRARAGGLVDWWSTTEHLFGSNVADEVTWMKFTSAVRHALRAGP